MVHRGGLARWQSRPLLANRAGTACRRARLSSSQRAATPDPAFPQAPMQYRHPPFLPVPSSRQGGCLTELERVMAARRRMCWDWSSGGRTGTVATTPWRGGSPPVHPPASSSRWPTSVATLALDVLSPAEASKLLCQHVFGGNPSTPRQIQETRALAADLGSSPSHWSRLVPTSHRTRRSASRATAEG